MIQLSNKVAVLGCGNGGMALAAQLTLQGTKVVLWSHPQHANRYEEIKKKKAKIVLQEREAKHTVQLDLLTGDITEAIQQADIIYNCTPLMAHTLLFEQVLTLLPTIQTTKLWINLAGVFSGIEQYLKAANHFDFNKIKIFDTSTFPYACRTGNLNVVTILGRKIELPIAPLFSSDSFYLNWIPAPCRPAKFNLIENSIKLGLMGTNSVFHPATMLFNARIADQGKTFLFYKEGISKKTSLLHEALDQERVQLASIMGYTLNSFIEDDNKLYDTKFSNHYDSCLNSMVHANIKSPDTLNHRFIMEDVGYGLVPLTALAKFYDIKLTNIESVINIFSTIMEINFYKEGRNLSGLTQDLIQMFSQSSTDHSQISI